MKPTHPPKKTKFIEDDDDFVLDQTTTNRNAFFVPPAKPSMNPKLLTALQSLLTLILEEVEGVPEQINGILANKHYFQVDEKLTTMLLDISTEINELHVGRLVELVNTEDSPANTMNK